MHAPLAELDLMAAICSRLSLSASGKRIESQLLEPLCTALGAEAAACRQWSLAADTPRIAALGSVGIANAVTEAYLTDFYRYDPALACLGDPSRFADFPDPASPETRASFQHYVRDFLEPNGLHQHIGFMLRDAPGRHVWAFNFHRNRASATFDALEHARARLLRSVLQGQATLLSTSPGTNAVLLSERELAVARTVGQGLSNKQIAAELGISVRTVENHLRVIYRKLNIHSRTQLGILLNTH
jgi:DNA-binding CsgD family transcriptional regulator